jgi:K+-transporting ATPase ATPase A chain
MEAGKAGVANPGAHASRKFSTHSSASGNNGSAFAGLSAAVFYNTALGFVCSSRATDHRAVLALAGSLAGERSGRPGTPPTHTPMFIFFPVGVVIVIGA